MQCIVCGQATHLGLSPWHYACPSCKYESAQLAPTINDARAHVQLNEDDREAGLKAIRKENFKAIIGYAGELVAPAARKLLDVGSAHGWFLEEASQRFDVLGMEPDNAIAEKTRAKGLPVRSGYFPDALQAGETFDVIIFNDVIEHIPDIHAALAACHDKLNPGGILVLNLPNSTGFFYVLSKLFVRLGWSKPFERLWQKGLPSPHVHYFHATNLAALVGKLGFRLEMKRELPSVRAAGLLARMRCAGKTSPLALYTEYLGVLAALPLLRAFPSDIVVCIFRKA